MNVSRSMIVMFHVKPATTSARARPATTDKRSGRLRRHELCSGSDAAHKRGLLQCSTTTKVSIPACCFRNAGDDENVAADWGAPIRSAETTTVLVNPHVRGSASQLAATHRTRLPRRMQLGTQWDARLGGDVVHAQRSQQGRKL